MSRTSDAVEANQVFLETYGEFLAILAELSRGQPHPSLITIHALRATDMSQAAIARQFDCPKSTISQRESKIRAIWLVLCEENL